MTLFAHAPIPRTRVMVWAACAVLALAGLGSTLTHAAGSAHAAAPTVSPAFGTSTAWQSLSPSQRRALTPLAAQWPQLDETSREKWITVASRFDQLSPPEQARMQERMTQWAALPAHQRGEARLRFQQSRQLPSSERQQKWAAYQALPDEDKRELGRQAQRRTRPVLLPDSMPGPREPGQLYATKRAVTTAATSPKKSNVVPNAVTPPVSQQTVVSPTLVKAGTGATTNLVTRTPTPPKHQQAGMTKITTGKTFVDPVTLLPRAGAQGAAMASLPASANARP